jgi:hypothetical protein
MGLKSLSAIQECDMAWYWPHLDTAHSAKTAVVNAVGVSVFFALLLLWTALQTLALPPSLRRTPLWLLLTTAIIFALIGWGIRRMSRVAAIVGLVCWLGWIVFYIPRLILAASRSGDLFGLIWVGLDLLFCLFYLIAVRATFAFHRHLVATPSMVAP